MLADARARVHVHAVPVLPELVLAELPPGTDVLVMTHDHAEDAALCDAALRTPALASIGLIGSAGKWTPLPPHPARRRATPRGAVDGIRTPIGMPELEGKDPATRGGQRRGRAPPGVAATARSRPRRPGDPGVTLFRGTVVDTPDDPFTGGRLRVEHDAGLLVRDGVIVVRGPFDDVRRGAQADEVVDLRDGLVLPGFVDTHVHFPQVRAVGGLGCRCSSGSSGAPCPRRSG